MREIKFRAWDKEKKKWVRVFELLFDIKGKLIGLKTMDDFGNIDRLNINRYELVQYTSLKDKHGKEIYEGDIIKYLNGQNMFVQWNEEEAMFCIDIGYWFYRCAKHSEVIGNIHENPELLEASE